VAAACFAALGGISMATVRLTPALRAEYAQLFETCVIRGPRLTEVDATVDRLVANRARYDAVSASSGVPWPVVAVLHNMEASLKFTGHLHNGDPLTARTIQVPKGRPRTGEPPFTWEVSAADALGIEHLDGDTDWTVAGTMFVLEAYNGFGYRRLHPEVLSPYLWAASEHYTRGKFVADGAFSETAVSKQTGAAVLLRRLAERGTIAFEDQPPPLEDEPLLVAFSQRLPRDPAAIEQAKELQRWLNTHPGVFVLVDGAPGRRTSDAFHAVTGAFLPGDPQAA
jgi:lysozyme family protein